MHKPTRRKVLLLASAAMAGSALGSRKLLAQSPGPVRIGHQLDISAYQATYAAALDRGAQAAVKYINEHGGIAGRQVEYVVEDTASDVPTGVRKFRRLVETHKSDFVFGDVQSGINLATNPVAKELKTLYFPQGESSAITGAKSNRYVFRLRPHSAIQGQAVVEYAVKNLGKNVHFLITDYAYGHSFVNDLSPMVAAAGGKVVGKTAVPVNTDDMLPYLVNVPKETELLFSVFVGPDALRFIRQSHEIGLSKRVSRLAPWGMIDATSLVGVEDALEGMNFISQSPRYLDQVPASSRPFVSEARGLMGVQSDSSLKLDPKRLIASSYYLSTWQGIFMIKDAIEKSGWRTKADNARVISALEGFEGKESLQYPMGSFFVRPQDHQAFSPLFLERVEKAKLIRVADLHADASKVPFEVDLTKEVL
jgi:branched-chain amino acid transport system substrate-binding protein